MVNAGAVTGDESPVLTLLLLLSLVITELLSVAFPSSRSTLATVVVAAAVSLGVVALLLLTPVLLLLLLSGSSSGQSLHRQARVPSAAAEARCKLQSSCHAGQWVGMLLLVRQAGLGRQATSPLLRYKLLGALLLPGRALKAAGVTGRMLRCCMHSCCCAWSAGVGMPTQCARVALLAAWVQQIPACMGSRGCVSA
jgi:hypothetical protein